MKRLKKQNKLSTNSKDTIGFVALRTLLLYMLKENPLKEGNFNVFSKDKHTYNILEKLPIFKNIQKPKLVVYP